MKRFLIFSLVFSLVLSFGTALYAQDLLNSIQAPEEMTLLSTSKTETLNLGISLSSQSNSKILKKVWKTASEKACSAEMQKSFSEEARLKLERQLKSEDIIDDLAAVLNPFLFSLGMSHTEFMTATSESYYFFKSYEALLHPEQRPAPHILNPGVQVGKDKDGYYAREVLTGFPADLAGLKKKDRLVSLDGQAFSGTWGSSPKVALVTVQHLGQLSNLPIEIKSLDWNQSFQDATKSSVQIFTGKNGKKIGYIHLWTGVHPQSARFLKDSVLNLKRQKISSIILDLRGGYGGAWWEHLEAFYPDSSTYMQLEVMATDGETEILKSPFKKNKNYFSGPMAVLINEGVRSGKEALAHQFKKTKRAYLIGEKTPGYFSTGQYFYVNEPVDYALYLCVYQLKLDGKILEGIGIEPDEDVIYKPSGPFGDSQLEAAVDYLSK
ncbi:MAG TPA: S41 family peptidase [Pseudobdellovibrionaceae bacterium]|jgi:carboxyl-terminal processing protease